MSVTVGHCLLVSLSMLRYHTNEGGLSMNLLAHQFECSDCRGCNCDFPHLKYSVVWNWRHMSSWLGHHWMSLQLSARQQKTFPSGGNGFIRVDALCQTCQRNPGGGLLRALHQYHASQCVSPSDCRFAVSSRAVGLYGKHTLSFPSFDLTRSFYDFVNLRNCVDPHSRVVSYLLTLILRSSSQVDSWSWHGEIERDDFTSCS